MSELRGALSAQNESFLLQVRNVPAAHDYAVASFSQVLQRVVIGIINHIAELEPGTLSLQVQIAEIPLGRVLVNLLPV